MPDPVDGSPSEPSVSAKDPIVAAAQTLVLGIYRAAMIQAEAAINTSTPASSETAAFTKTMLEQLVGRLEAVFDLPTRDGDGKP